MFLENKFSRKILLYGIVALFVLWVVIDPKIPLTYKDGTLIVLLFALVHSLIDNKYMLKKLSAKYEAQSKLLAYIFRNCGNPPEASYCSSDEKDNNGLIDSSQAVSYKVAKRFLNGDVRLYDAYLAPLKDKQKNKEYVGVVKDTTSTELLREKIMIQNAQLSSILNNMPFVIYLKDIEGRFIAGNTKLEELSHRKNKDLVGIKAEELQLYAYKELIKEQDEKVIKDKVTVTSEFRYQTSEDHYTWYRVTKTPVIGPKNKVLGIIVVIKDIDEEKELELQRDTFVATLTHDLKTPTNAQKNVMEILLKESAGSLNDAQRDLIQQAKNSNVYMSNMISTILATYKSEASETKLEPETFDFAEMVNDTCKELACLADTREQNIILKFALKNKEIVADKLQLKRAITNLISNAIIHGFEKSEVVVELKEKRNKVLFDVKNHSRYIEEERRAEIFEKYKSAKYAKSNKASTGLGLYLSREIIRQHCGEIYVNSWKNETCVFGFSIPRDFSSKIKQIR